MYKVQQVQFNVRMLTAILNIPWRFCIAIVFFMLRSIYNVYNKLHFQAYLLLNIHMQKYMIHFYYFRIPSGNPFLFQLCVALYNITLQLYYSTVIFIPLRFVTMFYSTKSFHKDNSIEILILIINIKLKNS